MPVQVVATPVLPGWLEPAIPFRRRMVRVGGRGVHLIDEGEGPVVLMLHGNPTWSFLWRKVIRRLPGHRAIAPDLVGFGLSEKPRRLSWHSVERHLGVLEALVDALEIDRVVVVGQDWGGPLAAGVASHLERSGRLAGIVLANTAVLPPRRPLRPTSFHRFSHLPGVSELAFLGLGFPLGTLGWVQGDPGSIGRLERRAYRWPLRRLRDRAGPLALARMVPHRDSHPSLDALDRIGAWASGYQGPAALVWGERDPVLGRALKRLREAWPQAPVAETRAGHFLQEEVPDALAEAIQGLSKPSSVT